MGDDIRLMNAGNTETLLQAVVNGAVTLRYDNTARIATTATGIDVTGNVTYSGSSLTVEDTLQDGSTVTWNAINSPVAKVTLAGNRTITVRKSTISATFFFFDIYLSIWQFNTILINK